MIKVIKNTYPKSSGVPHAKTGDECEWQLIGGMYRLKRHSDGKIIFCSPPVNQTTGLLSNGKQPKLTGIIGQVKSKGWLLKVEDVSEKKEKK